MFEICCLHGENTMGNTTFYDIQLVGLDQSKCVVDVYDNTYHLACFKLSSTPDKFWLNQLDLFLDFEGELKGERRLWIEQKKLFAGNYRIEMDKVQDSVDDFNDLLRRVNEIATDAKLEDRFNS